MGALAITQALGFGLIGPLPVVQSLTPWLLLPAFPIAVIAAWRPRGALALTAAGVALALLVLSAPIAFPGDRPDVAPDAPRFSVAFANVYHHNASATAGEAVLAPDADVLAVVELNEAMAEHLEQLGVDDRYPYRVARPHWSSEGLALYSRFPIAATSSGASGHDSGWRPSSTWTASPSASSWCTRSRRCRTAGRAGSGRTASSHRRRRHHPRTADPRRGRLQRLALAPAFHHLLGRGLRDVHEWMGRGFSTSSPVAWDLPPFVRLDHALLGRAWCPPSARAPRAGQRPPGFRGRPRRQPGVDLSASMSARKARPRCESPCFSAAVISANVRPSPSSGTKTGS